MLLKSELKLKLFKSMDCSPPCIPEISQQLLKSVWEKHEDKHLPSCLNQQAKIRLVHWSCSSPER